MLKEFAFTPHVFDPTAAPNDVQWRECMQAIVVRLFTQPAPPVLVSGLYAHGRQSAWEQTTLATINAIRDQRSRIIAEQLFKRVIDVLAYRPICGDWPGEEEAAWGREAADSHTQQPLDLVVAQDVKNVPDPAPAAALAEALSPQFWTVLHGDDEAPKSLTSAVSRLRTGLLHFERIVVSAPYLSTTEFALECVRQAVHRPPGFPTPLIDVHQGFSESGNQDARADWLRRQLPRIAGRSIVKWWFWPDSRVYRERVVLSGHLADLGSGSKKLAVRSGVSMTHVWGEGDPAEAEPTTWSLLSRNQAKLHADEIERRAASLGLRPIDL